MPKLSRISFFLFTSIYNYIYLRGIIFPYFYNNYGNMGFFCSFIILIGIILLFILFPFKKIMHYNNSIFKYFYNVIIIIESSLGIIYCSYLLSEIFILKSNIYIILFFIVTSIIILSTYKHTNIINISTLFIILGYLILFLTLFFYPDLDTSLLLPIKIYNNYFSIILFTLIIFLDNLKLIIYPENIKSFKETFIFGIAFSIILLLLEYFILITNSGDIYFKGLNWLGFISLSIEPVSKYLGNFDFAYVYYLVVCCVFKYGYNYSLIKQSINNSKLFNLILFILTYVICLSFYKFIKINDTFFNILISILLISISLLFWFIKEYLNVRKIERK